MTDYRYKTRLRSCGLLVEDNSLLLIQLLSPVTNKLIWTAPGGGVEFGETLKQTVTREFKEETGIEVKPRELAHINELIAESFHAVEFYFRVEKLSGDLKLGNDPELNSRDQIIKDLGFFKRQEVKKMNVSPAYLVDNFWKEIDP